MVVGLQRRDKSVRGDGVIRCRWIEISGYELTLWTCRHQSWKVSLFRCACSPHLERCGCVAATALTTSTTVHSAKA